MNHRLGVDDEVCGVDIRYTTSERPVLHPTASLVAKDGRTRNQYTDKISEKRGEYERLMKDAGA